MIFDTITQSVIETRKWHEQIRDYFNVNREHIATAAAGLKKVEAKIVRINVSATSIDLHVTGDRHILGAIFGAFRKLGYAPSARPSEEPKPDFSCYFEHPDHGCQFWLNFTSDKCTRVKVRTETREVDIYETVCE